MKTALQANRRTPPAGFEERSNIQVLRLTAETKPGRRMPRAAVILCVVLAVMGLATTLAATVDVFNARLHAFWPEAAEFLMPVNMSCEQEGIRMEVISAVVKDNKAHITFSLQDLEGNRLSEHTAVLINDAPFEEDTDNEQENWGTNVCLSYDAETGKAVYAQEFTLDPSRLGEGYQIPLHIDSLGLEKVAETDLHPLLEQYGKDVKTAPLPDNAQPLFGYGDRSIIRPESTIGLDPAGNLHIPLSEHAELSGIGWIDGMLHVQVHYPDHVTKEIRANGERSEYFPETCWIRMMGTDGISPWFWHQETAQDVVFQWAWDENGDEFGDWEEYIFPCDPAEVREGTLQAEVRNNEKFESLKGDWMVKIPMKMIQFENGDK